MTAFTELFGEKLAVGKDTKPTAEVLDGKKAVAVYFSAHWCPPCRGFTPKLAEWYKKDLKGKGLEVVFVSSDQDEKQFNDYYGEQPWTALPYSERDLKASLSKKYKVAGIPSLVILDDEGEIITKEGRGAVSEDPTGEKFPWIPPTEEEKLAELQTLLKGSAFTNSKGETLDSSAIEGKKLGLYFSAHWCPPCKSFTPEFQKTYK